jgi:hypothetical protein
VIDGEARTTARSVKRVLVAPLMGYKCIILVLASFARFFPRSGQANKGTDCNSPYFMLG